MAAKRKQSTVSGHCQRCNRHYFETRQSGGKVKYCPDCRKIVDREKTAERARRYRERERAKKNGQTFEARLARFRQRNASFIGLVSGRSLGLDVV
jgi:uncharacterized Zn finger protein (UPF0148 family)